jgi:hypothetical protein
MGKKTRFQKTNKAQLLCYASSHATMVTNGGGDDVDDNDDDDDDDDDDDNDAVKNGVSAPIDANAVVEVPLPRRVADEGEVLLNTLFIDDDGSYATMLSTPLCPVDQMIVLAMSRHYRESIAAPVEIARLTRCVQSRPLLSITLSFFFSFFFYSFLP